MIRPFLGFHLLAAMAVAVGCSSSTPIGPTTVARQQLYRVDNAKYDEFFEDVLDLQKQSATARDEEKRARGALAKALASEMSTAEQLASLVAERAKSLALGKPKIVLGYGGFEANGTPIVGKEIGVTPPAAKRSVWAKEARDFAAAFEETLRAEVKVIDKFGLLGEKARRRLQLVDGLRDSIGTELASSSPETREQAPRELEASRAALTKAAEDCEFASKQATTFVRLSGEGLVAAQSAKPEPKPPPAKGK